MTSVEDAQRQVVAGAAQTPTEPVALSDALGRTVAADVIARLTQPPFAASSMDGYALSAASLAARQSWELVGEAAAGHAHHSAVAADQTVRIFTGAPVPTGADTVVPQEDVEPCHQGRIRLRSGVTVAPEQFVRPAGGDFQAGDAVVSAGQVLTSRDLTLLTAMGHGTLGVRRQPRVAILATGDELVPVGTAPGPAQIVSSIPIGLAALVRAAGGKPEVLGIARDNRDSLDPLIARGLTADVLVTIGGASVGAHDLVQDALKEAGVALDFWRIAMRPGKPLMAGRRGPCQVLGLPGNPVSAHVTAHLFLLPYIAVCLGCREVWPMERKGVLAHDVDPNGPRAHYARARIVGWDHQDRAVLDMSANQDSSLMSVLAKADTLAIRPPHASAALQGAPIRYISLRS